MLYNKSAVKNRKPITREQIELARQTSLFKLPKEAFELIKKDVVDSKTEGKLKIFIRVSSWLRRNIKYDYKHGFNGLRNARKVWEDKKGHCIEQNTLFYTIMSKFRIPTKWLVVKNPAGYNGSDMDEDNVHSFLILNYRRNEYKGDFLGITSLKKNTSFCIAQQRLNQREFIAFCLQDAGEDFAEHRDYDNAFLAFNRAQSIDPNNYTIYVSAADAAFNKKDYGKAEKWYKEAIRIAPDILDTHKAYADFLFNVHEEKNHVRKAYIRAAKRNTEDLQILNSLEKRLYYLGERKLSEEVQRIRLELKNSDKFRGYFNHSWLKEEKLS